MDWFKEKEKERVIGWLQKTEGVIDWLKKTEGVLESCTDPQLGGHQDTARAYVGIISGKRSFPAMHISDKRRDGPAASSHPLNLSETMGLEDAHDQAHQEVLRWKDLLPISVEIAIRIEALMSQSRELAEIFRLQKLYIEMYIKLLSTSRDAIERLDQKGCRLLIRSIRKAVAHLLTSIPPLQDEKQQWASKIYLKPSDGSGSELSYSANPSNVVLSRNWYDHLYVEVKYMNYMYARVLAVEHRRLESLIAEVQERANEVGPLKCFLEKSLNLMGLGRAEIARAHKKECRMLVKLTKIFLICKLIKGYENKCEDYKWPIPNLYAVSEVLHQMLVQSSSDQVGPTLGFEAASNYSQCPGPDGCLSEGDWHDQAYKQLLSIRMQFSLQLDEAYANIYLDHLGDVLTVEAKKFLKKSLEFLATSRAEMVSISREKCYYRMMLIKFLAVLTGFGVSARQKSLQPHACASTISTWKSSPNWRDGVYEELRATRQKFSSEMDEGYSTEKLGLLAQDPELLKKRKKFLEESLDFLGCTRADLAFWSKEKCVDNLKQITTFFDCQKKHSTAKQQHVKLVESSSETCQVQNWRDEAYAEIKSKGIKFEYNLQYTCQKVHEMLYQDPTLARQSDELGFFLARASSFFTILRCNLAPLSKEEYRSSVKLINRDLAVIEERLTRLQISIGKRIGFPCDIRKMLLKQPNDA